MTKEHLKITQISKIEPSQPRTIPYAESLISAGFLSAITNDAENALDLNDLLIAHPTSTFFVRVLGDSMIEAGINSNDILIVDRSLPIAHNKIAIVRINDEFTVKRLSINGTQICLLPANPQYKPIRITKDMDFEVWGIVTYAIHQI